MLSRLFIISAAIFLTLPIASLSAATVAGALVCSVPGQTINTPSPGACNLTFDLMTPAQIATTANSQASVSSVSAFSSQFYIAAAAQVNNAVTSNPLSLASASADITETFSITTPGPVRPGYMLISAAFADSYYGSYTAGNGYSAGLQSPYFTLQTNSEQCFFTDCIIPVSLGTTFQIQLFATAAASSADEPVGGDPFSISDSSLGGDIRFVEQDQSTPVSFETDVAPEPAPGILSLFGLLLLGSCRRISSLLLR